MSELFARYLTPLTYLLWAMIIVGSVDHFVVEFLPRRVADANLYAMWPLLAIVWFGHKHAARVKAQSMHDNMSDSA